ncbi:MAG: hypothetical protein ACOCXA_02880 [Planctomycetota bacterium]
MAVERTDSRFWMVSALIHGIFVVIVLLSPAGDVILNREEKKRAPEVIRKDEELAETIEEVRDIIAERLRGQVELLAAGQERMATNFDTLNAHYQPFADKQRETARVRFDQEADDTIERQLVLTKLSKAAVADPAANMAVFEEALDKHEARVLTGQEEVRRGLRLLAGDQQDLIAMQEEAEQGQLKAIEFFGWARGTHSSIEKARNRLEQLETAIPAQKQEVAALEQTLAKAEKELAAAKQARQDAQEKDAERDARNRERNATREVRSTERDLQRALRKLEDMVEDQKKLTKGMPEKIKGRDGHLRIGSNVQTSAYWKQKEVVETLRAQLNEQAATENGTDETNGDGGEGQ